MSETGYVVGEETTQRFFTSEENAKAYIKSIGYRYKTFNEYDRTCGCLSNGDVCQTHHLTAYCNQCI